MQNMPSRNHAHGRVFVRWISSCFNRSNHRSDPSMNAADTYCRQLNHHSLPSSSECCPICLDELIGCAGMTKVLPRCGHEFHKECIDEWLPSRSLNCPVCREQGIEDDDHRKKLIRKLPVAIANGTRDDSAQAFAINVSSMHLGCFVWVN